VAKEEIGTKIHLHFPGNGPIGVYSYPLPPEWQQKLDAYGVKASTISLSLSLFLFFSFCHESLLYFCCFEHYHFESIDY
jgi:hypothetical protein